MLGNYVCSSVTVTYVTEHENMVWVALAQGSTSCKISREVMKQQVSKIKTMYIFLVNLWNIMCVLA